MKEGITITQTTQLFANDFLAVPFLPAFLATLFQNYVLHFTVVYMV